MNDIEWISGFTGLQLDDTGTLVSGAKNKDDKDSDKPFDPGQVAENFEADNRLKAALLAAVRKDLGVIKVNFQKAMQQEVKLKDKHLGLIRKKALLLNVESTQLDEADFEEILFTEGMSFEGETQSVINAGGMVIAQCHERLKTAKAASGKPLFTTRELEQEFWTPLMRERILPETFIADTYSLTRQMIDETNALYIEESDKRTKEGTATKMKGSGETALNGTKKALDLAGDIASNFGENGKIAAMALKGLAGAIDTGQSVAEKMEKAEWGDVASVGLLAMKGLTSSLLKAFKVPEGTVKAVEGGFDAGASVAQAAGKFAQGPDGVIDGVMCLLDALGSSLSAGSSAEPNKNVKQTLDDLSKFLPGAIKGAIRGGQLVKNVRDGDAEAAIKSLNEGIIEGFKLGRAAQLKQVTAGMEEKEAERFEKKFEQETAEYEAKMTEMLQSTPEVAARMTEKSRMAQHRAAVQDVIDEVGDLIEAAAVQAALPKDVANDLGTLYPSLVKAQTVLDLMFDAKFDATKAAQPLVDALKASFADVIELAPALAGPVDARVKKLEKLASDLNTQISKKLEEVTGEKDATKRSYEAVIGLFTDGLFNGLKGAMDVGGLAQALKDANTGSFAQDTEKSVAKKKVALAKDDLEKELAELQTSVDGMTAAQREGAEASGIDDLISKLQRDRFILNMAVNVMGGGADMLSKVVPGLAVASAGVRMVGQLIAAAQRAQQLSHWIDSRDDFEAAQSVLSSASRNFIKNQREQLTKHSIDAALELANMIAAAAELSGIGTAAGTATKAVLEGVGKFKDLLTEQYDEKQLRDAWNLFQKSMANPANRRLALQVRAKHPTLAKYTIAWGAHVQGDLLARNALRACGLTEASLRNPDADVQKVVQYLEIFYEEDQQLYRSLSDSMGWVPQPLELTPRYWAKLKLAAQTNKVWDQPSTGNVDGLLVKLETATQAVETTRQQLEDEQKKQPPVPLDTQQKAWLDALLVQRDLWLQLSSALDGTTAGGAQVDKALADKFKFTVLQILTNKARAQAQAVSSEIEETKKELALMRIKSTKKDTVGV